MFYEYRLGMTGNADHHSLRTSSLVWLNVWQYARNSPKRLQGKTKKNSRLFKKPVGHLFCPSPNRYNLRRIPRPRYLLGGTRSSDRLLCTNAQSGARSPQLPALFLQQCPARYGISSEVSAVGAWGGGVDGVHLICLLELHLLIEWNEHVPALLIEYRLQRTFLVFFSIPLPLSLGVTAPVRLQK